VVIELKAVELKTVALKNVEYERNPRPIELDYL